jgi:2,3-bisphosphoglycerate-independent phosphoglycerate mutase
VFYNFRGDRPRELTKAFTYDQFPFEDADKKTGEKQRMGFDRGNQLDVFYVTMTQYESGLPVKVAYPKPPKMTNIAGEYLSNLGLKQFRCAETEKYAHVTFFFNDYRDDPFPGEDRQLVASPKVSTYDQQPEMSAREVTEVVLERIRSGQYDFILLNYANPDMVGHTGSLEAAVKACQVVDDCVGKVYEAVRSAGGCGIITADHGNFEKMYDPETHGPHTAHTVGQVPLHVFGEGYAGRRLRDGGRLADVMPTILTMMGLAVPEEMTGTSLLLDE